MRFLIFRSYLPLLSWGLALLHQGHALCASGADLSQHQATLNLLELRRQLQASQTQTNTTFHDFKFSDQIIASRITFTNHVVEDAGKNYQAAHYDHGNGLAAADVDGDGLTDLYFPTQLGSSELWRNLGGGRFENITEKAGVGLKDQIVVSASFGDVDNDGDPDLFVTTVRHGNHLFENLGQGLFRDITRESGLEYVGHSSGAVWFDYDNDGRLDLFLVNVGVYTSDKRGPGGYYLALPDAFAGHQHPERTEYSILYHNLGGRRFKDVSREMNLRDGSWSGDATQLDLNQDGYPDLYVVNMQGDDHYYENQRGKGFVEKTAAFFPKTSWGAMGVKAFDFNQDGLMDLFVTDMHSDMTKEHTERALNFSVRMEKAKSEAYCGRQWNEDYLQGSTNNVFGNSFYVNGGNGRFVEASDGLGVETYWPWGISVGDLNADGFEDVFVTAGMGYPFRYAINSVLFNHAGERFYDSEFILGVEPREDRRTERPWFILNCDGADRQTPLCAGKSGVLTVEGALSSRSSIIVDLDNDGDLDIVTNDFNDRPQILISNLSERKKVRFLKIRLEGTQSNRDGLGASVRVRAGGRTWNRFHDGKSGYLSQSSTPLYFGLGDAETIEWVQVDWPSGRRQEVSRGISANTLLVVQEPRQ